MYVYTLRSLLESRVLLQIDVSIILNIFIHARHSDKCNKFERIIQSLKV